MSDKLRLKNEWFNPLYFHLRHYVDVPTIRKIMVYGGKGSAKTLSITQLLSILAYTRGDSSISYRKEQTTVKTTVKNAFKKSIGLIHFDNVIDEYDFSFKCISGSEMVLKGLDSEGKIKGVEGYKYLNFDELDHFELEEWRQANISLRGLPDMKLLATWNPVDEKIWIKKLELDRYTWTDLPLQIGDNKFSQLHEKSFVRLSNDGKILLIKTTYFDNKWIVGGDGYGFLDQNLIDEYESTKDLDLNYYNVNVLGLWGVANRQGKFAWAFDENKHVGKTEHNPLEATWLTFDFNVNPMTCSVIQHYDGIVKVIRTIRLENSNTWAMCDRILSIYPDCFFMVTGDATGGNRNAASPDEMDNYSVIMQKLGIGTNQVTVPNVNPKVTDNQLKVNALLLNYPVQIDPDNAAELIYDLNYVEMNERKEIIKDRSSPKKFADFLDNFRYWVNVEFADIRMLSKK